MKRENHIQNAFLLLIALVLANLSANVEALYFILIPGANECIFFKTDKGDRVLGSYEIDSEYESVRVFLSKVEDGTKVLDQIKNTGDFSFDVQNNSEYSLCFKNLLNSIEQTVNFSIKSMSNTSNLNNLMSNQESKKLLDSMKILYERVVIASEKQRYSLTRKRYQMDIIESSRKRATFWSVLELIVSFTFVFLQVYTLKSYFNVKYLV
ncbi:P24 like gold domain proteinhypothetical protein transmembrane region near C-terminus [Cryptosporidium ryanae]|uniref:P24 like gold domain proteinhypothetical protein transmembrane region near C-terminus n=1 Tax=Cryptosporidium ryanae TaxID=515981 RepID=UPI00351A1292|nr:P24 like gold domain proteinhypothetical protein transmembrane region near C-terminus [Cryptosporidium ryanae]